MENLHLLVVAIGMCAAYFTLVYFFAFFFEKRIAKLSRNSLFSILLIICMSALSYQIAFAIPDPELGNRVLHGLGGGFIAFVVCVLAARDIKLRANTFQLFFISFLIVSTLGIANEVLECILQNTLGARFATSINDTWFDLISNTIGAIVGAVCSLPFFKGDK